MCYGACLNEQFIRQHMKNKTIFRKWLSMRCLDTHLAKSRINSQAKTKGKQTTDWKELTTGLFGFTKFKVYWKNLQIVYSRLRKKGK